MKEKDQDRSIFKEILGWLVYIAILLAAVYVLIKIGRASCRERV